MSKTVFPIVSVSARQFVDDDRCRFRPSTRPGIRVVARLTGRCTFTCEHCLASAAGNVRSQDLPVETWKTILADLPKVAATKVLLTGGEPMLFEGLADLTSYVAGMGVTTDLNSTLWFMTDRRAAELAEAGLTEASVGIEGPEAIHDALLGRVGAFRRLVNGIKLLQEVGIPVDGSMYITPINRPYVNELIELAGRLRLESFTITRMLPVGHGLHYAGPCVSEEELVNLHDELDEARKGRYGIPVRCVGLLGAPSMSDCRQGHSLIGIRADGTLTPCVLTRDVLLGVPRPEVVGLSQAVAGLRTLLAKANQAFCYGGAS